jgi:hypothetical protein
MYVEFAYGTKCRELADALWRDREYDPLGRCGNDADGRQTFQTYVTSLLRWGMIRWNPHAKRNQSNPQWLPEAEHLQHPLSDSDAAKLYDGR